MMKHKLCKQNLKTIYLTMLILLLSLQGEFNRISIIKYVDELFAIFSIAEIAIHLKKIKKNKEMQRLFNIVFMTETIIVVIGGISNIISDLTSVLPIFIDMFGMIKLPVSFIYVTAILSEKDKNSISNNFKIISRLFIVIVFFCGVINCAYDIKMSYDIRYGLRSYTFLFSNPGGLNATLFAAYSIVLTTASNKTTKKLFEYMTFISIIMTLRGSGIGVVGVLIMLRIYNHFNRMNKSIDVKKIVPVGIGAIILAWNQIVEYFIQKTSLRSLILRNSFVIFKRYFPWGSGFATYGSDQAFKRYSKLYYEFEYNNIHMLSPGNGRVANDNFWPMIIAQFGPLGFISYLYMLYSQFRYIMKLKIDEEKKIIALGLLSVLLIGSIGNAVYTSASGLLIYLVLGIVLYEGDKRLQINGVRL